MATTDETSQLVDVHRAFVRRSDGKFLLVQRKQNDSRHSGLWELPGGKVDHSEVWSEALARAIQKQTGLEISKDLGLVYSDSFEMNEGKYQGLPYAVSICLAQLVGGVLLLSDSYQNSYWVTASEAIRIFELTPEVRQAIAAAEHRLF